ncbi:type IV pilus assembly protein FimV [Magnetococcales bacterium HHB-1]
MRKKIAGTLLGLALVFGQVSPSKAVSLGEIEVKSVLGDPFVAEIPLKLREGESLAGVDAAVGRKNDYRILSLERPVAVAGMRFRIIRNKKGARVVVRSIRPIHDPFFNLLLRFSAGGGVRFRNYPIFLNIPGDHHSSLVPSPSITPVRASSAPVVNPVVKKRLASPSVARATSLTPTSAEKKILKTADWPEKYGPVRRGETLFGIAKKVGRAHNVSSFKLASALFETNKMAFNNGDVNQLRVGEVLYFPQRDKLSLVSSRQVQRLLSLANKPRLRAAKKIAPPAVEVSSSKPEEAVVAIKPDKDMAPTPALEGRGPVVLDASTAPKLERAPEEKPADPSSVADKMPALPAQNRDASTPENLVAVLPEARQKRPLKDAQMPLQNGVPPGNKVQDRAEDYAMRMSMGSPQGQKHDLAAGVAGRENMTLESSARLDHLESLQKRIAFLEKSLKKSEGKRASLRSQLASLKRRVSRLEDREEDPIQSVPWSWVGGGALAGGLLGGLAVWMRRRKTPAQVAATPTVTTDNNRPLPQKMEKDASVSLEKRAEPPVVAEDGGLKISSKAAAGGAVAAAAVTAYAASEKEDDLEDAASAVISSLDSTSSEMEESDESVGDLADLFGTSDAPDEPVTLDDSVQQKSSAFEQSLESKEPLTESGEHLPDPVVEMKKSSEVSSEARDEDSGESVKDVDAPDVAHSREDIEIPAMPIPEQKGAMSWDIPDLKEADNLADEDDLYKGPRSGGTLETPTVEVRAEEQEASLSHAGEASASETSQRSLEEQLHGVEDKEATLPKIEGATLDSGEEAPLLDIANEDPFPEMDLSSEKSAEADSNALSPEEKTLGGINNVFDLGDGEDESISATFPSLSEPPADDDHHAAMAGLMGEEIGDLDDDEPLFTSLTENAEKTTQPSEEDPALMLGVVAEDIDAADVALPSLDLAHSSDQSFASEEISSDRLAEEITVDDCDDEQTAMVVEEVDLSERQKEDGEGLDTDSGVEIPSLSLTMAEVAASVEADRKKAALEPDVSPGEAIETLDLKEAEQTSTQTDAVDDAPEIDDLEVLSLSDTPEREPPAPVTSEETFDSDLEVLSLPSSESLALSSESKPSQEEIASEMEKVSFEKTEPPATKKEASPQGKEIPSLELDFDI